MSGGGGVCGCWPERVAAQFAGAVLILAVPWSEWVAEPECGASSLPRHSHAHLRGRGAGRHPSHPAAAGGACNSRWLSLPWRRYIIPGGSAAHFERNGFKFDVGRCAARGMARRGARAWDVGRR